MFNKRAWFIKVDGNVVGVLPTYDIAVMCAFMDIRCLFGYSITMGSIRRWHKYGRRG